MWQQFLEAYDTASGHPFAFLSVAVDVDPERARPYASGCAFPTAVDSSGTLGRLFDFDVVPNGLFLDSQGVIRFLHIGGFDIRRPEIEQQVRALLATDFATAEAPAIVSQEPLGIEVLRTELAERPADSALHAALGDVLLREGQAHAAEQAFSRAAALDPADWSAPFGLGTALYQQGRTADALAAWRQALALDPDNFTVRKQIWMIEHPDRFYPEIDHAWQQEQLARERGSPTTPG